GMYFRWLVLAMAFRWGRRHVAKVYRYLEAEHHRSRLHDFFLVERWEPAAALRQKAHEWLRSLHPGPGETVYWVLDDSQHAQRGQVMDAVTKMKDPMTEASIRGPHSVGAMLICRGHVIAFGIRRYGEQEPCAPLGVPFRKTTALAARLIREFQAPRGLKVVGLFAADDRCPTVVTACRQQRFHLASTRKANRRLFKQGWKLEAGREGRTRLRRRRTDALSIAKPHGRARYRVVDAGWLAVGTRGRLHVVCSRQGSARKILGLGTDAPALSAAHLIQTDERRWTIEPWVKDLKPLLGLGQYQHRPSRAAVMHRPLVCFASALLTHRRLERHGAQGPRRRQKAADGSTAATQDQRRQLLWGDLMVYLREKCHSESVRAELERLRVA
ncbi:MAG: hypothetical protein M3361_22240, partial [Candidatus Tectomicrobia bacterium]|nr:hypothetical protein [Candidatus Tectomicrobia bacterium]